MSDKPTKENNAQAAYAAFMDTATSGQKKAFYLGVAYERLASARRLRADGDTLEALAGNYLELSKSIRRV